MGESFQVSEFPTNSLAGKIQSTLPRKPPHAVSAAAVAFAHDYDFKLAQEKPTLLYKAVKFNSVFKLRCLSLVREAEESRGRRVLHRQPVGKSLKERNERERGLRSNCLIVIVQLFEQMKK